MDRGRPINYAITQSVKLTSKKNLKNNIIYTIRKFAGLLLNETAKLLKSLRSKFICNIKFKARFRCLKLKIIVL